MKLLLNFNNFNLFFNKKHHLNIFYLFLVFLCLATVYAASAQAMHCSWSSIAINGTSQYGIATGLAPCR